MTTKPNTMSCGLNGCSQEVTRISHIQPHEQTSQMLDKTEHKQQDTELVAAKLKTFLAPGKHIKANCSGCWVMQPHRKQNRCRVGMEWSRVCL